MEFAGQVAIVTGGATGIGYATALQLAMKGADVVIASRTEAELAEAAARIGTASGRRCLAMPTDVKDEDQVVRLVQRTVDELGRIDILINNAGGTRMGPLTGIGTRAWDSSFDLNVRSAYVATREAGRHMIAQGSGAIVNISSGAGISGVKGGAHYSASKAALQMFTTVTAAEWGPHGVRVNCVAPGLIASERAVAAWQVASLDGGMTASIPLRRAGTPEEVANAIVFFCSDAASYISGQTLYVSGGPMIGGIQTD